MFGPAASSVDVALFGDSHAVQWFNPVRAVAAARGWRLTTFFKSRCAASDIVEDPTTSFSVACSAWRADAIRQIATLRPRLVLMASFTARTGRGALGGRTAALDALRRATQRTLQQLNDAGLRVVVFRDTPLPPVDIPTCLARSALHVWHAAVSCDFERSAALDPGVFEAEEAAAHGLAGVTFLDLSDAICPAPICPATRDGVLVYRDDNHLTGAFATTLAPALAGQLKSVVAE